MLFVMLNWIIVIVTLDIDISVFLCIWMNFCMYIYIYMCVYMNVYKHIKLILDYLRFELISQITQTTNLIIIK